MKVRKNILVALCLLLSQPAYAAWNSYHQDDSYSTGYGMKLEDFKREMGYKPESVQPNWLVKTWQNVTTFFSQNLPKIYSEVSKFFANIKNKLVEFFKPVVVDKPLEKGYFRIEGSNLVKDTFLTEKFYDGIRGDILAENEFAGQD